jgi:hypothetical protein
LPSFSEDLLPRFPDGSLDTRYSKEQIEKFSRSPAHRETLEGGISQGFQLFMKKSPQQKAGRAAVAELMRKRLAKRPELAELLIPDWELGCRRCRL